MSDNETTHKKNPKRVAAGQRIQQKRREELEELKKCKQKIEENEESIECKSNDEKYTTNPFIYIVGAVIVIGVGYYVYNASKPVTQKVPMEEVKSSKPQKKEKVLIKDW